MTLRGVASAIYPVLPLLNHSGAANTVRISAGGAVILVAARWKYL